MRRLISSSFSSPIARENSPCNERTAERAALAVAALLWPLLHAPTAQADRATYNVAVFQDQLKEVDRDLERGVLTDVPGTYTG